jgi:ParB-like chromosome segregation protein Spo0J
MSRNDSGRLMHPSASMQIESKLAARHVSFVFEPNLHIDQIRDVEGNQVRLSEHRAPKAVVDRYAEQMKGGAVFPAIVVNDRHELVDGNTRWLAAQRNNKESIAAYVCADLSALQARSLSVELNQSHGLSMTDDEIQAFVTSAVEEGQVLDAKAYSRMTGVKASTLARWVAAKHFEMRAARDGITADRLQGLSNSVRAALQVAKLRAVFLEVTALAIDARVPAAQLKVIITEANAASSEAEALAVVVRARKVRSDDVKAIAAGFKSGRRKSVGSALHIGGLLRFEVADLLDVSPDKQGEMFARMRLLRERLDGTLARASVEWSLPTAGQNVHEQVRSRDFAEVR